MMEKRGHNAGRARTTGRVGTHTRWASGGAPADAAAPGRADLVGTRPVRSGRGKKHMTRGFLPGKATFCDFHDFRGASAKMQNLS